MQSPNQINRSYHKQNPQRIFDHYQSIYNNVAYSNKIENKNHKNLYYALIQKQQKRKQDIKSLEKHINQHQNQQIDLFWKMKEQELKQKQRKQKQMINQVRNQNNKILQTKVKSTLSKSMIMQHQRAFFLRNQYQDDILRYQNQVHQNKQFKKNFLEEGQIYDQYKKYSQKIQKEKLIEEERKKLQQNNQIQRNRIAMLEKWKQKHLEQHNKEAYKVWDQTRKGRLSQQEALQNYIVNQGARQLDERTYRMKNQFIERQKQRKQSYINELHCQLEGDEYRNQYDKRNQQEYERKIIQQREQLIREKNRMIEQQKAEQHKNYLQYLRTQIKPRNLVPEKDKIEFAGIGSPLHIGKVVADDRKKQLQWLEKSLNKDLAF